MVVPVVERLSGSSVQLIGEFQVGAQGLWVPYQTRAIQGMLAFQGSLCNASEARIFVLRCNERCISNFLVIRLTTVVA